MCLVIKQFFPYKPFTGTPHLTYPLRTSWHRVPPLFLVSLVKVNFLSFWFLYK